MQSYQQWDYKLTRIVLKPPSMHGRFEGLHGGQVVQGGLLDHIIPKVSIFGVEGT